MKLVLISDTHGKHQHWTGKLPDGDVLIHAGDCTNIGTEYQVVLFLEWFSKQPHKHKIFIAGNHDFFFERQVDHVGPLLAKYPGIVYLNESGVEIDGVKFWGSPWQPWFHNWAFNYDPPVAGQYWDKIPFDTDVLITHGPPYLVLDWIPRDRASVDHVGCPTLRERVSKLNLKLHVFGHIHEAKGVTTRGPLDPIFVNASMVDGRLDPYEEVTTLTL